MEPAITLILELREDGMTVELDEDRIIVSPVERITDQLRARIRCRRVAVLEYLHLEERIRAMADRWGFAPEDLAEELARSAADPAAALVWVKRDERRFSNAQQEVA
jgi:hypothetical protein